ncbi:uncharacterized protein LOC118607850 isoform X2 [Rousettus aegyptiacus]|uniref:uncharacterized protein LOC118607850 isoform X2 n=1 Tax=Rousettus aegyptiacus TaxID=9407 RepID=UPI00168D6733|nr:uncharacterized protein LOC118607850 isoform X2 [Rousettus aegyptiacus]
MAEPSMVSEMEFSEDPVSDRETREPPDVDEHRAHPVGQPCSVVSVSGDLPSAPCMLSSPALWGDSVSYLLSLLFRPPWVKLLPDPLLCSVSSVISKTSGGGPRLWVPRHSLRSPEVLPVGLAHIWNRVAIRRVTHLQTAFQMKKLRHCQREALVRRLLSNREAQRQRTGSCSSVVEIRVSGALASSRTASSNMARSVALLVTNSPNFGFSVKLLISPVCHEHNFTGSRILGVNGNHEGSATRRQ